MWNDSFRRVLSNDKIRKEPVYSVKCLCYKNFTQHASDVNSSQNEWNVVTA